MVPLKFETAEDYCLHLIHTKAYSVAAELAADQVVLDLGCNNGYGSKILNKRCARVVGVDVSERAIELARQLHLNSGIEFRVIEGNSLPFSDKTFDMIASFQVIEHVSAVELYLREIHRVLKPRGWAFFTTPNREIRLDPEMKPWNPYHIREYTAEHLEEVLAKFFPEVNVKGLFATPDLYAVELARVKAARNAARAEGQKWMKYKRSARSLEIRVRTLLMESMKVMLPNAIVRMIQGRARRRQAETQEQSLKLEADTGPMLEGNIGNWSLNNLYYDDDNLSGALDLMAICRKA